MTTKYNIEDIAKVAGVSRGTVSRVLNQHPSVRDETRHKVLDIIEKLNYRPNFSARHMRTDSSNLFGFLADDVITSPYAVDMIRGAQEVLWAQGKVMLVVNAGDNGMTEASLEVLLERRVEGIIYAAMYHRPVVLPRFTTQVPIVLTNCFSVDGAFSSVVPDEVSGGYAATHHVLAKGHRRIGFINLGAPEGDIAPIPAATGRLEGYKKALADHDIAFDPALLLYTEQTATSSYQLTCQLMQLSDPPTAIFCGNDRTAMGAYGALSDLGLRVPDDIAVVGFDNFRDIADNAWPPLTTIQLPHYDMGRWAVEYLMSSQYSPEQPIYHKIECPLVVRKST